MKNTSNKSWPLGIIFVYGIFVIGLIAAVFLSVDNNVQLVTNNYYEKTLTYQSQIDRIKNTQALTQQPDISFSKEKTEMILTMPLLSKGHSYSGTIRFFRPSNSSLDQNFILKCNTQGIQHISLSTVASGMWKIQLQWSDGQKEYYLEKAIVI